MFYKHNYKKEKEEEEEKKEKGKVSLIFQKIKDMDRDDFKNMYQNIGQVFLKINLRNYF